MPIFLDTSIADEIKYFHKLGIIRGVTTNPSIISRDMIDNKDLNLKDYFISLANLISPLPLSIEVTSNELNEMIDQSLEFSSWAKNINVKITIHGPKGELENIEVIHILENKHNLRVNVTAMMSAQQGLIASLAGASYVSLFGGRVNNMGYNSIDEIKKLRKLIDFHQLKSKIIIGSTREVLNIVEWLVAGADIVTCAPQFIKQMIIHPYTKETVQMFLNDAKNIQIKK